MNLPLALSFLYTLFFTKFRLSLAAVTVDAVHVCAFSSDTKEYTPNCYDCRKAVYTNALLACLNATAMPSTITYKNAICMEGNCNIHYFSPTTPENEEIEVNPMLRLLNHLLMGGIGASTKVKRSVDDNTVDRTSTLTTPIKLNIVERVETVVGAPETDERELDYAEM